MAQGNFKLTPHFLKNLQSVVDICVWHPPYSSNSGRFDGYLSIEPDLHSAKDFKSVFKNTLVATLSETVNRSKFQAMPFPAAAAVEGCVKWHADDRHNHVPAGACGCGWNSITQWWVSYRKRWNRLCNQDDYSVRLNSPACSFVHSLRIKPIRLESRCCLPAVARSFASHKIIGWTLKSIV